MKKIIHIALGKANPNRLNGVNKVVNDLLTYQAVKGWDAQLWGITFNPRHDYPTRNYTTYLFKDSRVPFAIDDSLKQAISALDPAECIVHLHGGFIPQFYSIARLLRQRQIRYFFTPHGAYNEKALKKSKWRKRLYIQLVEKSMVNGASGVQLLGRSEKKGYDRYFKTSTHFVPNGQELMPEEWRKSEQEQLVLGFLGRIDVKTKGLDVLLEGVKKAELNVPFQLEIIGDGGEIAQLKQHVKALGLEDVVLFKGALFGSEKMKTLGQWDALCLTSRNEGLPGAVLEAAGMGVPVLVSEATNMGDYVRKYNAGWVVKTGSADGLAGKIKTIAELKSANALKDYNQAARQMIRGEFSWNRIVEALTEAYGSCFSPISQV